MLSSNETSSIDTIPQLVKQKVHVMNDSSPIDFLNCQNSREKLFSKDSRDVSNPMTSRALEHIYGDEAEL